MKAVVDTNVIAYYLLGTPDFQAAVMRFWKRATDLMAPALWEAEIANVIWMAVRSGVLSSQTAVSRLEQAGRLGIHSVAVRSLWQGAVLRATASNLAVYDTLFVELAEREGLPLITFDRQIRKAFPGIARAPA